MTKDYGAYMDKKIVMEAANKGVLSGKRFAVKDVFSIKGHISSAGNPDWLNTHEASETTAPVIVKLVEAGASLEGTTVTDELMYSLNGENYHYGTPVNPADENRIPGGSSSGSAVAVAASLCDFSIGTDTGGSVRVPSSYCGLYGIRPTHGLITIEDVIPLARSFDTVGWMAKDAETLLTVGKVLIDKVKASPFTELFIADDAWELTDIEAKNKLRSYLDEISQYFSSTKHMRLANEGLKEWAEVFRMLQGKEIWEEHGEWIETYNPTFGPGIAERFQWASTLKDMDNTPFLEKRRIIKDKMEKMLNDSGILIIPTVPGIAPKLNLPVEELEVRRNQTFQLCCIAGLSGLPQVNIPIAHIDGAPIGLSFIAGRNQDLKLLQWVKEWTNKLSL